MKSRFYIWLSLVAGLLATSCNDAFMDRQPHTEIGADSYFNTEEDLKMKIKNFLLLSVCFFSCKDCR